MNGFHHVVDSPLGRLLLVAVNGALTRVDWTDDTATNPSGHTIDPVLRQAAEQLAAYFTGRRRRFDLPLAPDGTAFRQKVWAAMQAIPYGQTSSYGDVARSLGSGPRAVGGACGANPLPIIIPCHRILAGSGLGGYSGRGGLDAKQFLLRHEAQHRA